MHCEVGVLLVKDLGYLIGARNYWPTVGVLKRGDVFEGSMLKMWGSYEGLECHMSMII